MASTTSRNNLHVGISIYVEVSPALYHYHHLMTSTTSRNNLHVDISIYVL
jgi:hypothetical protein